METELKNKIDSFIDQSFKENVLSNSFGNNLFDGNKIGVAISGRNKFLIDIQSIFETLQIEKTDEIQDHIIEKSTYLINSGGDL